MGTFIYCFIQQKQQMQQTASLSTAFGTLCYPGPELYSCKSVDPLFSSNNHLLGVYYVPSVVLDAMSLEVNEVWSLPSRSSQSSGGRQKHPQTDILQRGTGQERVKSRPDVALCVHSYMCVGVRWEKCWKDFTEVSIFELSLEG